MNPIAIVQKHPLAVGASVLAVIAVVVIASGMGGGSTEVATVQPDDGAAMAGLQLQQLQQQAQLAAGETNAKLQLGMAQVAASKEVAVLQAQTQQTANAIAGNVALAQVDATKYQSSLAADVEGRRIAAELAERQSAQATIQAQSQAQIAQTNAILAAQIEQARIAAQPKGLFSWLFG